MAYRMLASCCVLVIIAIATVSVVSVPLTTPSTEKTTFHCGAYPCPYVGPPICNHTKPTTVIQDGHVCPGCDVCVDPPQTRKLPPFQCLPLPCPRPPEWCTRFNQTTMMQNGHVCPGCPVCIDRPPVDVGRRSNHFRCLPLPCPPIQPGCNHTKQTTVIQDGHVCPGCYVCTDPPFQCRPLPCPHPPPGCKHINHTTVIQDGHVCPGCDVCTDPPFHCTPLPCPAPPPGCTHFNHTTSIQDGHVCPGCDVCTDPPQMEASVTSRSNDYHCLPYPCPYVGPPFCNHTKHTTIIQDGHVCPFCDVCTDPPQMETSLTSRSNDFHCLPLPCPYVGPPFCNHTKPTTVIQDGHVCPGCDVCTDPPFHCVPEPCPAPPYWCHHFNYTTNIQDGHVCPGCPVCLDPPPFHCTPLPCPKIPSSCKHINHTTVIQDGHVCPGCDVCTDPPFHCVPPPCPAPPSWCHHFNHTTSIQDGHVCPGCPVCIDPPPMETDIETTAFHCNHPPCPYVGPPWCRHWKNTTMIQDGHVCPGCDVCIDPPQTETSDKTTAFHCIPLPCPYVGPPFCNHTKPTTYIDDGHVCPGCDVCIDP